MKVRIEIDTKTFVRFWLVVIAFVLAALIIYSARVAFIIIGLSAFLAIAFNPHVNNLAKVLPGKSRVLSTAISYMIVVVVVGAVITLVVPPIVDQTVKFSQNVPSLIDSASKNYSSIGNFINKYHLQTQYNQVVDSVKNGVTGFASFAGSSIISGIGSVISMVTAGILVFVLTFLMIIEGPTWFDRVFSLYKDGARMKHHRKLVKRIYLMISSYVTGQLTVSSIAAVVAGLAVFVISTIFNTPANLAIPSAAIVFVLSLVPLFGELIAAITISLILLLTNWTAALVFLIFFFIYLQLEANIISPRIQSKRLNLTPLAILIAVTIGVYLFGIFGGIISVPVAGCINILVEEYIEKDQPTVKE